MSRATSLPQAAARSPRPPAVDRRLLIAALAGGALNYLAQPPVDWAPLAWIAPTPWLLAARLPHLPGRRPYLTLWLGSLAFWLPAFQWLRLPHWANYLLLVALAAYVAAYLPVLVALVRVAQRRLGVPLWLAAPVAWTAFEWLRAHLFTGFLMASLAHSQVRWRAVIQLADLAGEYGVTFLMVLVAAAIAAALPLLWLAPAAQPPSEPSEPGRPRPRRPSFTPLLPAALALAAALAYGHMRLAHLNAPATSRRAVDPLRVALIQSDLQATLKGASPEADAAVMRQQIELSRAAVRQSERSVDVVIWAETMYREPLWTLDAAAPPPAEGLNREALDATRRALAKLARELDAALLVGVDRLNLVGAAGRGIDVSADAPYRVQPFNSSVGVDRTGRVLGHYDKMHLLPFGEYVPLVDWFPFFQRFSPITGFAAAGADAVGFELGGVVLAPNICYETVLPHVIRRQVVELAERGRAPDVLVNLTNDSWYEGSSELDMHLASGVMRAIEMRTPLVVAANRGLTAHIDHRGEVVQVTQRDRAAYLLADVAPPPRQGPYPSFYAEWGDWLPLACLACCAVVALLGRTGRRGG